MSVAGRGGLRALHGPGVWFFTASQRLCGDETLRQQTGQSLLAGGI